MKKAGLILVLLTFFSNGWLKKVAAAEFAQTLRLESQTLSYKNFWHEPWYDARVNWRVEDETGQVWTSKDLLNTITLSTNYETAFEFELTEEQSEFAYLTFDYVMALYSKISGENLPRAKVTICGEEPIYFNESEMYKGGTIRMKNPGSCVEGSRLIRVEMIIHDQSEYLLMFFDQLNLQEVARRPGEVITAVTRETGEELVLRTEEEILGRGAEIVIAENDWEKEGLYLELWRGGSAPEAWLDLAELAETNQVMAGSSLTFVNWEKRAGELWGSGVGEAEVKVAGLELVAVNDWMVLQGEWDELAKLRVNEVVDEEDSEGGERNWKISGVSEEQWQAGFYLAGRLSDYLGNLSPLSEIWFCQAESCRLAEAEGLSAGRLLGQLEIIGLSPTLFGAGVIELANMSEHEIDLREYYLSNSEGERIDLQGLLAAGERLKIYPSQWGLEEFLEAGKIIYLYKAQGEDANEGWQEPIEIVTYSGLMEPRNYYQKQPMSLAWKGIYVRE